MCFAPQWRATCWHLNFQKWPTLLRATAACHFSTSQLEKAVRAGCALYILICRCASRYRSARLSTSELPKVVRRWRVLYILTWKCALRHSVARFFIARVTTWPRTCRFSDLLFDPPDPRIIGKPWKNKAIRDFPSISRDCISFLLTFALLHLLSADLTTLLCFSTLHVVESLTTKLPSIIHTEAR